MWFIISFNLLMNSSVYISLSWFSRWKYWGSAGYITCCLTLGKWQGCPTTNNMFFPLIVTCHYKEQQRLVGVWNTAAPGSNHKAFSHRFWKYTYFHVYLYCLKDIMLTSSEGKLLGKKENINICILQAWWWWANLWKKSLTLKKWTWFVSRHANEQRQFTHCLYLPVPYLCTGTYDLVQS